MKRKYRYKVNNKTVERELNYIPVRYIIAVLITLLETLAIIGTVIALSYFVPYFYLAVWATEIGCVVKIISSDDNPDYKIPWLLFVLVVPIGGFMLYFLFYSRKLNKKYIRRLERLKDLGDYKREDAPLLAQLRKVDETAANQANMLIRIADTHLFTDTKQTYFPLGEDMHKALLEDLTKAERFIFMEYFIIEEGKFWNSILEILKEKAATGVKVRVVYDDIGCMSTLPGNYAKILRAYGIEGTPFSRLKGNADSEFNNRSHRKITVIDGKIGYTGGVNIADEYINETVRFGHWKDVGIRLEGEAVFELTRLFLIDYGINIKPKKGEFDHPIQIPDCFPKETQTKEHGYLIPFGDGPYPTYNHRVGKSVIQNLLENAKRYVYITTPYLIIDNDLCQSLENTALKGVDVRIITPHIPDKKLVFSMTRSFYPRLMQAGVKIYEYEPGFMHAKTYLVDDEYAMIGTINLDYRSLVHHFENGVWLYRTACLKDIRADFDDTFSKCVPITRDMLKLTPLRRFFRALVRVFAPLL
ncbi:MAG: cardiolipin synthase [Clostridia bacterium]|nr:cardiolipin synthase [Clostridia bacterium]